MLQYQFVHQVDRFLQDDLSIDFLTDFHNVVIDAQVRDI